jgi:hypothetical protein
MKVPETLWVASDRQLNWNKRFKKDYGILVVGEVTGHKLQPL